MNRRILDRFILADARLVLCQFEVLQAASPQPAKVNATFQVKPAHLILEQAPEGMIQACESTIEVALSVSSLEEPKTQMYTLRLRMAGLFLMTNGDPLSEADLVTEGHCFTRMLFPLVRSEISRVLGRARLSDLPVAWDTGPTAPQTAESPPDEQSTDGLVPHA